MYESKVQIPLTSHQFAVRLFRHLVVVAVLLLFSLGVGMWGYHELEGLSWMDGFLNSAMLLGGMGPVNPPQSLAGKLFAGCYALYAGLVFIVAAALMFSPVLHRVLHFLHWEDEV